LHRQFFFRGHHFRMGEQQHTFTPLCEGEPVLQQTLVLFREMCPSFEIVETVIRMAPFVICPDQRFEILASLFLAIGPRRFSKFSSGSW
jgi:hypothetical protein